jgi:hypothetical protein
LQKIKELMGECSGIAIVAFERTLIRDGVTRRGSTESGNIVDVKLPTVWNQIEAAMGYTLGLPLLVIVEKGLRDEGLLESRYDWFVKRIDLQGSALNEQEFLGVFADWKGRVQNFHSRKGEKAVRNVRNMSFLEILKSLNPSEMWAVCAAVLTALSAVAALAYKLGTLGVLRPH